MERLTWNEAVNCLPSLAQTRSAYPETSVDNAGNTASAKRLCSFRQSRQIGGTTAVRGWKDFRSARPGPQAANASRSAPPGTQPRARPAALAKRNIPSARSEDQPRLLILLSQNPEKFTGTAPQINAWAWAQNSSVPCQKVSAYLALNAAA